MQNNNISRVGIVVKPTEDVIQYLKKAIHTLKGLGKEILLETTAAGLLGRKSSYSRENIAQHCDLIVLIGGDGTFLSIAEAAVSNQVPVAGFNLGTLGFLTENHKETLESCLNEIFARPLRLSNRKLVEIHFKGNTYIALNDVVASKGNIARIITLALFINGTHVADVRADGLIISTPTGSTAYSIAAGGPIVTPDVNGLVVTPICPHSLTFRPLVIPDNQTISVKLGTSNSEVFITIDGQKVLPFQYEEEFRVVIHRKHLKMIVSSEINYFRLLNEKLNWGL